MRFGLAFAAAGPAVRPDGLARIAKSVAHLDVLSGGRVTLGAGAGWLKEEHDAFGIGFYHPRASHERTKPRRNRVDRKLQRSAYSAKNGKLFRKLGVTRVHAAFHGERRKPSSRPMTDYVRATMAALGAEA